MNRIIKMFLSMLFFISTLFGANDSKTKDNYVHDVVILGGGIGALTSGVYLSRAGYSPLIIEGPLPGGLITQSLMVENWPGEMKIMGAELVDKIKKQAEKNGCLFLSKEIVDVNFLKKPFELYVKDVYRSGNVEKIKAKTCIIAMGSSSNYLNVKGEKKYWGRGVSNCAVCDGSLYKNKDVAVIGGGDAAILEANYLSNLARHVYVIVRKDKLKANDKEKTKALNQQKGVKIIYNTEIAAVNGNDENVSFINLYDKKNKKEYKLDVDGLFLAIGSKPNTSLFKNKLQLDPNGYIKVNKAQQTSVDGIFAIGDIVDPVYKQAITAAGDGAKAAISCQKILQKDEAKKQPKFILSKQLSQIVEIRSLDQFKEEMQNSSFPVIVDFYATWCGPCKKIEPFLDDRARLFQDKIKILKVNVDINNELTSNYGIAAMPTIIVFDKDKNVLFKKMGTNTISLFLTALDKVKDKNVDEINDFLRQIK